MVAAAGRAVLDYRIFGRTGVKISPLILGSDNFGDATPAEEAKAILNRAFDAGINMIDTGDVYADGMSERIIGEVVRERGNRHSVVLATKVDHGRRRRGISLDEYVPAAAPNMHGHSRLNIIRACEASLRSLQTDYIDLYQLHRPTFDIPLDETLGALDDLVRDGKVRYIGCSTQPAWLVMEGLMASELKGYCRYVSEQPPYNLLDRRIENELVPMCQRHGLGIICWGALGMGVLAGRYTDHEGYPADSRAARRGGFYADRVTRRGIEIAREFAKIAGRIDISAAQLALLWCKDQPGITAPLLGTRTLEHLEHLLPVAEMSLDDETRAACDELVPPGSVAANFHNTAYWMKTAVSD
jgi:aryl-alcohol dehydrogenase-like predicted oxidoreductase